MATYNGEKYIEEQLKSIINQTYQDWRLIISDDASKDRTVAIIKQYQRKYPRKIFLHVNDKPTGSAKNNFYHLLDYIENDYVMFSDQDDVWLNNKISKTYNKMLEMEKKYGSKIPLLVHTDLCVVDENLQVINKSFCYMQGIDYKRNKLNNLLVENIATGCSMMINRALVNLLYLKPHNSVMHDAWIALIASTFGHIGFIRESTILYRQHGDNCVGAKNVHELSYYINKFFQRNDIHDALLANYSQADEFLRIFFNRLGKKEMTMLCEFSFMHYENARIYKFITLLKYRLFKKSYIKKAAQILYGSLF